jgi:hypothetical protein
MRSLIESKEIVCLFKNLMRWRSQIWWNDVIVKFNEMRLFSSNFNESLSSNLMSRFRQIWWIVFLKFDEMFHKRRLIINVVWQIENKHTSLDKSRTNIRHSIIENEHASFVKSETRRSKKLTMKWSSMITKTNRFKQSQAKNKFESHFSDHISRFETRRKTRYQHIFAAIRLNTHCSK